MIKPWDYLNEYKKKRKSFLTRLDKVFKSGKLFFGEELSKFESSFIKKMDQNTASALEVEQMHY